MNPEILQQIQAWLASRNPQQQQRPPMPPNPLAQAPQQFGPNRGQPNAGPMPAFVPQAQWQGAQMPQQPPQNMINPYGLGSFAMGNNISTTPQQNPKVLPTQIPAAK